MTRVERVFTFFHHHVYFPLLNCIERKKKKKQQTKYEICTEFCLDDPIPPPKGNLAMRCAINRQPRKGVRG